MLPQKKNPDIAELARGKAGRLIGNLTGSAGDAEGPAAGVQPRPAGGQGAAVRLGRPGRARASAALTGMIAHGDVRARADAGGGRCRRDGGDRPRRVARSGGHAVPRGARDRRRARASPRWPATASLSRARRRGPTRRRCGSARRRRAWASDGARRRAAPARRRSTPSWCGTATMLSVEHDGLVRSHLRSMHMRRVPRSLLAGDAPEVAPELLNKLLVHGACVGRIVEVEAYREDDPGEPHLPRHDAPQRGDVRSARAPVRVLHVRHAPLRQHRHRSSRGRGRRCCSERSSRWPASSRCGSGVADVVSSQTARPSCARRSRSGPSYNGVDLLRGTDIGLFDDGTAPPVLPVTGPRIGISKAVDVPWRFRVPPPE